MQSFNNLNRQERVELTQEVKLNMPKKVKDQIRYLCDKISVVEWSGVLFYSIEGSITDPKNMVINLEDILPMHKGTGTYTEYTFDDRVIEYMMDNETMEKGWKLGHIHSHNNMAVFFSGTDWSELHDNAPNHNVYLSLIVNNKMEFTAKICYEAKQTVGESTIVAKDENGAEYIKESITPGTKDLLMVHNCNIIEVSNVIETSEDFNKSVDYIISKATPTRVITQFNSNYGKYSHKEEFFTFDPSKSREERIKEEEDKLDEIEDTAVDKAVLDDFLKFVIVDNDKDLKDDLNVLDTLKFYMREKKQDSEEVANRFYSTYFTCYQQFFDDASQEMSIYVDVLEEAIDRLEEINAEASFVMEEYTTAIYNKLLTIQAQLTK